MKLQTIFVKPVDRKIEGVIKADDDQGLRNEVEEYVLTNEIEKRLEQFLDAYNNYANANGVWISGFFGSGKSHLLKMMALLLENREIEDISVYASFEEKCEENKILAGALKKAVSLPTESILFNIDQKADIISKKDMDALLSVFVKVFDEHCGYYGKLAYVAQFERKLDQDELLADFKTAFERHEGQSWNWGCEQIIRVSSSIDAAFNEVTGANESDVINKFRSDYKLSIEDFAEQVQAYVKRKPKNFRLNFFVDEVGQYIADNSKLMVNLQTIAESFSTKCAGQAWIIVTSQADMSTVVGDMAKVHTSTDFSKIQDRFKTRLSLTSQNVSEVIQKRLLAKKQDTSIAEPLQHLYESEKANFRTLFEFRDGSKTYKTYPSSEDFCFSYPFVHYQYDLFQEAINGLSTHNAFTGKHASVGERSMLGVFQEVVKKIGDENFGELATFDFTYEGIKSVLKPAHQQDIISAERNLSNTLAVRILKALFLVKYVKGFKGTAKNVAILMVDSFTIDLPVHQKAVQEALNILEHETYIQRTGEIYEFLTNDEKDVEEEIKSTEVEESDLNDLAASIVFDEILNDSKIRHAGNGQDYQFSKKLDGRLKGREHELSINIITPLHDLHDNQATLINQGMGVPELLVILANDPRLLNDLNLYTKTEKFIRQNNNASLADSRVRILSEKGQHNINRKTDIRERLKNLIAEAPPIVNGSEVANVGTEPKGKIIKAFQQLISITYSNLNMLGVNYSADSVRKVLTNQADSLFQLDDDSMGESEKEVLTHIKRKQANG